MISNSFINKQLKLTARLMELHGENDFKIRAYQKTTEAIKMLDVQLAGLPVSELIKLEGIGRSTAEKIVSIAERGQFSQLDELLAKTPAGVIELLDIPGFGAKKIAVLWKESGAETLEQVQQLCLAGEVAALKGFAAKSQESLLSAAQFKMDARGKLRYADAEPIFKGIIDLVKQHLADAQVSETGTLRRRMEVVSVLEVLVGSGDFDAVRKLLDAQEGFVSDEESSGPFTWRGRHIEPKVDIKISLCKPEDFDSVLMKTTGSVEHLSTVLPNGRKLKDVIHGMRGSGEAGLYESQGLQYVEPEMREGRFELDRAAGGELPQLVEMRDLKGILHSHSTYSDGKHTLRQMAEHCRQLGYEYLGISDHSQTAVYAGGLPEYKVKAQQQEIRQLNEELAPFKIFSGIESDILNDGKLDYPDEVLAGFDFTIASVHSGLNMDIGKATDRLLKAIRNPYTTILGHMTGRLLLNRAGYPVDHKQIILACAERDVVIELNASPYRLDIDWRWVGYALEKGVMLSINPDAHEQAGYQNMYYGLLAGRKGGLTREKTLNAMTVDAISAYFEKRKASIQVHE